MQNDSKNIETKTDMQNWWETDAQYTDIQYIINCDFVKNRVEKSTLFWSQHF